MVLLSFWFTALPMVQVTPLLPVRPLVLRFIPDGNDAPSSDT
jgi:hypothetical protein